jgi:hypothetical protein
LGWQVAHDDTVLLVSFTCTPSMLLSVAVTKSSWPGITDGLSRPQVDPISCALMAFWAKYRARLLALAQPSTMR